MLTMPVLCLFITTELEFGLELVFDCVIVTTGVADFLCTFHFGTFSFWHISLGTFILPQICQNESLSLRPINCL